MSWSAFYIASYKYNTWSYILLVSGLEISELIRIINSNFDMQKNQQILQQIISGLPLSDSIKAPLNTALDNNLEGLILSAKDFTLSILKSIVLLSSDFVFFLIITVFSLYYFYIGLGSSKVVQKKKTIISSIPPS